MVESIKIKEPSVVKLNAAKNVLYVVRKQGWGGEGAVGGEVDVFYTVDIESGETCNKRTFNKEGNGFDFNPDLDRVYIKDTKTGNLLIFDGYAKQLLNSNMLGKRRWFQATYFRDCVSVNRKTGRFYVTEQDSGILHVLEG